MNQSRLAVLVQSSCALGLFALADLHAQDPILELRASHLRPLETAARSLAAAGRPTEVEELLSLLSEMGHSEAALERLRERCAAERVVPARIQRSLQNAERELSRATGRLIRVLEDLDEPQRLALAGCLVRLGGDVDEAHEVLGHVRSDTGGWTTPAARQLAERREEIQDAIRRARHLEVPLQVAASHDSVVTHVKGEPGLALTRKNLEVHTSLPEFKARRILEESYRALALSNWILTGHLEIPEILPENIVLLGTRVEFLEAYKFDRQRGRSGSDTGAVPKASNSYSPTYNTRVMYSYTEGFAEAGFFAFFADIDVTGLHGPRAQACLVAGHANLVSLAYLGEPLPGFVEVRVAGKQEDARAARTSAQGAYGAPSHEEMRRLSYAGLRGTRSWLKYLVQQGQAPAWSRSMVNLINEIDADSALKCTFIAEYLAELGISGKLVEETRDTSESPPSEILADFEQALGMPVAEFERDWEAWLLGHERSLVERLSIVNELSKTDREVLEYLNELRGPALIAAGFETVPKVTLDTELSAGALLHAQYLHKHRDQLERWPDGHEEYPDREGFTPAGAWAGSHSVIAPQIRSPGDAIDGWMATFYHRLPLLEPGVLRIGYGQREGIAVLDAGSMVWTPDAQYRVAWPPNGAKDVPVAWAPELPNPVPGEDQSNWGYPITLQLHPKAEGDQIEQLAMSLHAKTADSPPIDCYFSSPLAPTNPNLAPGAAFCLIPKARLKRSTEYVVVVLFPSGERMMWRFET